ncbi:MAG TPA: polymer-forming cytoskeletal protein [Polyangiaceae bacterium]|jgi:cytoskeletal protein CcmA (bactofilin family)|nr:polymer-forming cytoskeletal protein [Polyangiaceae bacterium]
MSNTLRPATKVTIVEEGTEFKGTLTSSCPIDVRGKVEGELKTPALTVSSTGAVHGRATVGEVHSQGEISGEFDADKIELSGVVRDNTIIRARSLDVKLGAQRGKIQIVFGECELSVGEEPTEHDHVAPPMDAPVAAVMAAPMVAEAAPVAAPMAMDAPPAADAAAPAEAAADDEEDDGDDAGADGETAEASAGGKRKRKRKNGRDEAGSGWSHPPSRPPPAN